MILVLKLSKKDLNCCFLTEILLKSDLKTKIFIRVYYVSYLNGPIFVSSQISGKHFFEKKGRIKIP